MFVLGILFYEDQNNNLVYLTTKDLKSIATKFKDLIDLLFSPWEDKPINALETCSKLIFEIKENLSHNKDLNNLGLEYLHRFNLLFNQLFELK